jgi:hypothetical protein
MNETRTIARSNATRIFLAASLCFTSLSVKAIQYNPGDLLMGFRQPSGSSELVVDLGSPAIFSSLSAGTTITITNYNSTTFSTAFSDPSSVDWSVFGCILTTTNVNYVEYTEWATSPRANPQQQTTPWVCSSGSVQASSGNNMNSVGGNAVKYATANEVPVDGVNNTATSIIIPAGNTYGYEAQVGSGNWKGKFQGVVEADTPADFSGANFVRADLYYMPPGSGNATYWGYFQLNASGTMTFTAASAALPPPALKAISPTNGAPAGGTLVTLTGSNFVSGITVGFGSLPASSVNFSNSTLITAVTPASSAGALNVTVTNPDTQTSTLMNGFTYAVAAPPPPPTISTVTMSGANVVLVTAGGTNASCRVLTSTNPASAAANWTPVATNAVGSRGLFTNTIPINRAEPQRYFLISMP